MKISVGKDVEKLEPWHIAGGNVNGMFSTMENILAAPEKVKHRIAI